MSKRLETFALHSFFFISGISALLYQVIWTKKLTLIFGLSTYAVSTTLSVFMLGLALGSWYFGKVADTTKKPLLLYCLLEAGIAGSAGISLLLLEAMNSFIGRIGFSSSLGLGFSLARMGGSFAVLIVPTILMGGTLPVLAKVCVKSSEHAGRELGLLYAANTLGGVAGCFMAGFISIPLMGMRSTLLQGVALNIVVASLAYLLYSRRTGTTQPALHQSEKPTSQISGLIPEIGSPVEASDTLTRAMLIAFFISGFLGLAGEVVWTRMALLSLDPVPHVFASILCVCLLGLALGSLVSTRLVDKYDHASWYGAILVLTGMSVFASLFLWSSIGANNGSAVITWFLTRFPFRASDSVRYLLPAILESALLLFLPCLLMGLSFPFAARFFSSDLACMGKRLGLAYMLNTLGGMAGPLVCGFWLLPLLGIQNTIVVLSMGYAAAGSFILISRAEPSKGKGGAAAVAMLVLIAVFSRVVPDQVLAFLPKSGPILSYEEDLSGSVLVVDNQSGLKPCHQLIVGVTSMIADNLRCRRYTRLIGNIPMLLHPAPRKALVICLGSGMTLSAVASHPDIERIDCVDLSEGVVHAARNFFKEANSRVLEDPRVHLIVNDGRIHLVATDTRYDVICLEPPPPNNAGVANLYSREFYELCYSRLNPGGMISQWIPYHSATLPQLRSLVATMQAVFPTTTMWDIYDGQEYCAVGHKDGGPVPFERLVQRLSPPVIKAQLDPVGIRSPEDVLACFLMGPEKVKEFTSQADLVTDDLPGIGYDFEGIINLGDPLFNDRVQQSIMYTHGFSESPLAFFSFETDAARAAFEQRFKAVKTAWLMHSHATRVILMTAINQDVLMELARDFVSPLQLDPQNPYYQQADEKGVYSSALNAFAAAFKQLGDDTRSIRFQMDLIKMNSKLK